jgi:DNA-binding CsgD family transcriptional regulator/PAS domain-containing protein
MELRLATGLAVARGRQRSGRVAGNGQLGGDRVGGIDCALDARLCTLLDSWCLVVGADLAVIMQHDGVTDRGRVVAFASTQAVDGGLSTSPEDIACGDGSDPVLLEARLGELGALDPDLKIPLQLAQTAAYAGISGLLDDPDNEPLLGVSPGYHWLVIGLGRQNNRMLTLAVACAERRRIQLVKSRLRLHREAVGLVVRMWQETGRDGQLLNGLATTVESLADGVIIASGGDRILYVNQAARGLTGLRTGDTLRSLPPLDDFDHLSWLQLLAMVQRAARLSGHASRAPAAQLFPMMLKRDGARPLIAAARNLDPMNADGEQAAVVLFVIDPDSAADDEMIMVCQLHSMTPTESRLAIHLAKGLTLAEASAAMRIKQQTARAYLKQIFDKFGVHRQADLIRLLLRSVINCRLSGAGPQLGR